MHRSLEDNAMSEAPKKSGSCLFTLVKIVLLLIVVVVAAVLVVGFFVLDGKFDVSREITINAPPEAIHKQVGDLREWPNWLPFTKEDKTIKVTVDTPTGVGAHEEWTGNSNGELTFTTSDENKGIEFTMIMEKKYKSKGAITYAKSGDGTRVTWRMDGQNDDFTGKWLAAATPIIVGPMFDKGLADLKAKVEAAK
jgi:uncharacterized protein YndB with AHSA1/START domain